MAQLIYLIGPSGSGKDTLLQTVRAQMRTPLMVAHRYITRAPDAGGENHIALSREEFDTRRQAGLFALSWEANGQAYGIGIEVDEWLARGLSVVVNGSRAYLPQARARYGAQLFPVCLTVSEAQLYQRLLQRGRESERDIQARLQRAAQFGIPEQCQTLSADGTPQETLHGLLQLLNREKITC